MRTAIDVALFWAAFLAAISATGSAFEMRGPVAEVVDGESYSWSAQEFAGFYYDLDDDAGGEHLSLSISDGAVEASGAVYATRAQAEPMEFSAWGSRWTIGFLGEAHFAGYSDGYLSDESGGEVLLRDVCE